MNAGMTRYDFAYLLLSLISIPIWPKYLTQKRYRRMIRSRLLPEKSRGIKPSIWMHAVSVGEVNSLLSLIDDLASHFSDHQVVLTVSTPSGYRHALEKARSCLVVPAPLDFSFSVKRFISTHQPRLIILNELEIWPNWLSIAQKLHIPLILINGRLSDNAFSRYLFFRRFSASMLNRIQRILCQSDHYRKRFLQLGIAPEKVIISGHIKADEAARQLTGLKEREALRKELRIDPDRKKILFASSHSEDEVVFFPLLQELSRENQVIIAPRHLDRTRTISDMLKRKGIRHHLWSEETGEEDRCDIVLFDRMGKLLQLMALADAVVMGGTFSAQTGGHNLFEPLACSKLILGGPHTENFPDIAQDLIAEGLYIPFETTAELQVLLQSSGIFAPGIHEKASQTMKRYSGANETILREIKRCLSC